MDILSRLSVGDQVKTLPVAKTVSGNDGSFILRVDPSVSLAEFTEDDGIVNLSIRGSTPGAVASFAISRQQTQGRWLEPGRLTGPPPSITLSLVNRSSGLDDSTTAPAPMPAVDKLGSCGSIVRATYNDRKGLVGEVYTGPHTNGDFTYTSGSTSSLGVGLSVSGSFGSFSQNGTASASSTSGIDYPTQGLNVKKVFQTSWQYKKIQYYDWDYWGIACYSSGYEARPTLWWGSSYSYNAASAPTATYCSSQLSGATVWKETGSAQTFSNGLDLNVGALGLHLSTKTGFDTKVKIKYVYKAAGSLCGSNTTWPYAARVVAK